MTIETLAWIVIGSLFATGFILKFIGKPRFVVIAAAICWISGCLLYIVLKSMEIDNDRYDLMSDIELMKKYHLSQVDSSMALISADKNSREYFAYNFKRDTNAVFHFRKEITLDIYDVYKVRDEFANGKIHKDLIWIYRIPNWFRDSSSVYYLRSWDDIRDEHPDTLTKPQFIKILNDWGLKDKIFKEYHPFTYGVPVDTTK